MKKMFSACHPSAARLRAKSQERKSKDPENLSSAMQMKGVLLNNLSFLVVAKGKKYPENFLVETL
ncbi:MAG TPA: hypothetical protein VFP71_06585 [Candidatus Angelobacter sp.]|nr:hypothetical protein [Candidatus Angelobacter sp.]